MEDLRQLVNPSLNFPNLSLALLDERLLIRELMRRELGLQYLRLALLLGRRLGLVGVGRVVLVVINRQFHARDDGALPLRADLLRALEGDKG